jgi:hypothetical protein
MQEIKLANVAKSDIQLAQDIETKMPGRVQPTETIVSIDVRLWKINLKGLYKRVTGRIS